MSVVIPTLGGDSLAGTIDGLNAGTLVPAEILVCVPQGYAEKTRNLTAPNVRVVETADRGQVPQRIAGFCEVQYRYVLQIDDDVAVGRHCLERLVAAVDAGDGRCSVAAALRHIGRDESVYAGYGKHFLGSLYYVLLNGTRGYAPGTVTAAGTEIGLDPALVAGVLYDVDWLPGGCVMHHRRNLVLTNYYPHSGKAYCEDLYHSRALSKKGIGLKVASDAVAWIEDPRTTTISLVRWLKDMREDYRARRHYLKDAGGSAWRMHVYYALRLLSHLWKLLFRPER